MGMELYQIFFISDMIYVNVVNYTGGKASGFDHCLTILITVTVETYLTIWYRGFSSDITRQFSLQLCTNV